MTWFRRKKGPAKGTGVRQRSQVPEGLWLKCESCKEIVYSKDLEAAKGVCPKCEYHFRMDAPSRIRMLLDAEPPSELYGGVRAADPLEWTDTLSYRERYQSHRERFGMNEAVIVVEGRLEGSPIVLAVMDFRFMGGSMSSGVGEKITRAVERAIDRRWPLVIVSASGGARMQEGALSLMQMAKVSAALSRLRDARLPYLSVLTDPTTAGVMASFAMLGDVNIAEPDALIGFTGQRVIEQTIGETLPEGFQRSEFVRDKGFLDVVVSRHELRATLGRCLRHLGA
ncbi:MAG: acetyl-CoA carboxylase, carboxyltransferase subunit beta [Acidobacteriota bacterium]|nr:acetyl-CoA carboxylase, carboxyltransferase subunit beta [Acidobacteriota bacterium]